MFDEVAGAYREHRPLAFFDGQGRVVEARVSPGGQEMAAMICHVGYCAGTHAPVSADALQHLWISRDAGRTWGDLGQVPASTPLVGDSSLFGEESSPPSGTGSGRTIAWRSLAQGYDLFAIGDQEGAVQRVYGSEEPLGDWQRGVSITGDLVVWWEETYVDGLTTLAGAQMVDLATAMIHKVAGLSLPLGFDPEAAREQDEFYYVLTAARPAPTLKPTPSPTPAPEPTATPTSAPATEYLPLTMGEPRAVPAGTALYYLEHHCEGAWDTHGVIAQADAAQFRVDRPLAFFDELSRPGADLVVYGVSGSGQTLATLRCERGFCWTIDGPDGHAVSALWVSEDGGETWERWGEVPVVGASVQILTVTDDDVALFARKVSSGQGALRRAWWFRSGQELPLPEGLDSAYVEGWRQTGDGPTPIWSDAGRSTFATAPGERLAMPPSDIPASEWGWSLATGLPDGSLLWGRVGWNRKLQERDEFVIVDEQADVVAAFSWEESNPLEVIGQLKGELYAGLLGPFSCGDVRTTVLVDLGTGTVHTILGLNDSLGGIPRTGSLLLHAARPAPD